MVLAAGFHRFLLDNATQNELTSKNENLETLQNELTTIVNANKDLHAKMDSLKQEITRLSQVDILMNGDALKEQWVLKEFELKTEKENLSAKCDQLKCLLEKTKEALKVAIDDGNEKDVAEKG